MECGAGLCEKPTGELEADGGLDAAGPVVHSWDRSGDLGVGLIHG